MAYTDLTLVIKIPGSEFFTSMTFSNENKHAKCVIYIDLYQFLVAKVWQRNLDYVKNLQAKPVKILRSMVCCTFPGLALSRAHTLQAYALAQ